MQKTSDVRGNRLAAFCWDHWKWHHLPLGDTRDQVFYPCGGTCGDRQNEATIGALLNGSATPSTLNQLGSQTNTNDSHVLAHSIRDERGASRFFPLVNNARLGIVIEQLLMIGGVATNLGPVNKICYDGWTCNASRFLWSSIGAIEVTMATRVKRLLKYFDLRIKGVV